MSFFYRIFKVIESIKKHFIHNYMSISHKRIATRLKLSRQKIFHSFELFLNFFQTINFG